MEYLRAAHRGTLDYGPAWPKVKKFSSVWPPVWLSDDRSIILLAARQVDRQTVSQSGRLN